MQDRELSESALDLLLTDIIVWPARVAHHSLVPTRHLAAIATVAPVGPAVSLPALGDRAAR
jgi:hypothetical protein